MARSDYSCAIQWIESMKSMDEVKFAKMMTGGEFRPDLSISEILLTRNWLSRHSENGYYAIQKTISLQNF